MAADFEQWLAEQISRVVSEARVEAETRRGPDSVRVRILVMARAADVGQATRVGRPARPWVKMPRLGLPWDPVQIPVLLTVLCLAGIRHDRAVLCWLWALTLIPWWLRAGKDGLSLVTAGLGSLAFVAMAIAADRAGSERRARTPRSQGSRTCPR